VLMIKLKAVGLDHDGLPLRIPESLLQGLAVCTGRKTTEGKRSLIERKRNKIIIGWEALRKSGGGVREDLQLLLAEIEKEPLAFNGEKGA